MLLLVTVGGCGGREDPRRVGTSSSPLSSVAALPAAPRYLAKQPLPACDPAEAFVAPGRWVMRHPIWPEAVILVENGRALCVEAADRVAAWLAAECPHLLAGGAGPCDDPVPVRPHEPRAPGDDPVPVRTAAGASGDRAGDDPVPVVGPDDF